MISAGKVSDVEYYVTSVGGGRESYYLDAVTAGEPPGRWAGRLAAAHGLSGEVDADDMRNLFHQFSAPDGSQLGQAPGRYATLEERLDAAYAAEPDALPERRAEIRRRVEAEQRKAVLGWDLTHSVPKSVSVAHTALWRQELADERAGDTEGASRYREARLAVENAIHAANEAAMNFAEAMMVSRAGRHGATAVAGKWIEAPGGIRASFFQHTSRALDPQLHTHNVWLNRVECVDGKVRAIDGAELLAQRRAVDAVASRVLAEELARLGFVMETREDGQARELMGIPDSVAELFSTRRGAVNGRAGEIIADLEQRYGRELTAREVDFVKRSATVRTRDAKTHEGESWEEMLERHNAALTAELGGGLAPLAGRLLDRYEARAEPVAGTFSPDAIVREAVAAVAEKDATWTRAELANEIERRLPPVLGIGPQDVPELLDRLVDRALALGEARQVAGRDRPVPASLAEPGVMFRRPSAARFAATATLADEETFSSAALVRGRYSVPAEAVHAWLDEHAPTIGADQRDAVVGIASSDGAVSVLIGPAGTGKSFATGALAKAWHDLSRGGRVQGLTVSQVAANVLAEDGVRVTANCTAWLAAQDRIARGRASTTDLAYAIQPRDLIVVDEASMIDTYTLTKIQARVEAAGARLVLPGDPEQLDAIGAGGAMELAIRSGADTFRLEEVRRFVNEWEAAASLRLRAGDTTALDEYDKRGRIIDAGTLSEAIQSAAKAAAVDILAGRSTLVVAGTNEEAAQVATLIRDQLLAAGVVQDGPTLHLHDGGVVSAGDYVMARRNDYPLGMVNRNRYRVTEVHTDGGMTVANEGGELLPVPVGYVRKHVTSAYASTVHAAEGLSVDAGHDVGDARGDRRSKYVAGTRGRESNTFHVATVQANTNTGAVTDERPTARAVLEDVFSRQENPAAATLALEEDEARLRSADHLLGQLEAYTGEAWRQRLTGMLDDLTADGMLSADDRRRLAADAATPNLARLLRAEEQTGADLQQVLAEVITSGSFGDARSVAQVLSHRITNRHATADDTGAEHMPANVPDLGWMPADAAAEVDTLRRQLDDRRRELGTGVAEDSPEWAVNALGSVPNDPVARLEWEQRAGRIAAYREAVGWADEHLAVGHSPGTMFPERRDLWADAYDAAGSPAEQRPEAALSEGALRARIRAGERAETWAPAYPDTAMRTAHLDAEQHRRAAVLAEHVDQDEAAAAEHAEQHDQSAAVAVTLEQMSTVRGEWWVRNVQTLSAATAAREEMERRGISLGGEPDRVTAGELLAAERAARVEDDPYRVITETDLASDDDQPAYGNHVAAIVAAPVEPGPDDARGAHTEVPERPAVAELDAYAAAAEAAADRLADIASQDEHGYVAEAEEYDYPATVEDRAAADEDGDALTLSR